MRSFEFSKGKFDQLVGFLSRDQALASRLLDSSRVESQGILVLVDESDCEKLGDLLTEELAVVGFDSDYNLTQNGVALESFIDLVSDG